MYILALETASPGNRHCASCIGTLSFGNNVTTPRVGRALPAPFDVMDRDILTPPRATISQSAGGQFRRTARRRRRSLDRCDFNQQRPTRPDPTLAHIGRKIEGTKRVGGEIERDRAMEMTCDRFSLF